MKNRGGWSGEQGGQESQERERIGSNIMSEFQQALTVECFGEQSWEETAGASPHTPFWSKEFPAQPHPSDISPSANIHILYIVYRHQTQAYPYNIDSQYVGILTYLHVALVSLDILEKSLATPNNKLAQ